LEFDSKRMAKNLIFVDPYSITQSTQDSELKW